MNALMDSLLRSLAAQASPQQSAHDGAIFAFVAAAFSLSLATFSIGWPKIAAELWRRSQQLRSPKSSFANPYSPAKVVILGVLFLVLGITFIVVGFNLAARVG